MVDPVNQLVPTLIEGNLQEELMLSTQLDQTVQGLPDIEKNRWANAFGYWIERGSLLPAKGFRSRNVVARRFYYHEGNNLFRGAISGLIKRIQSTPYELKVDTKKYGNYWDRFLRNAAFSNWDTFISQLVVGYSIFDTGSFIEIIAPGDPTGPPTGPASGIAILDSVNCAVTGDPIFPVIYTNRLGIMHILHHTRVVQMVDIADRDDNLPGGGDCALSRCITPINEDILISNYNRAKLDDKPPPGILTLKNISESQFKEAAEKMLEERGLDSKDIFGRTMVLMGMDSQTTPEVDSVPFSAVGDNFDFEKFINIDVKRIALGIGLDVQDVWELSGGGIGTGTQSEILHQKSKGKAYGSLLKKIERSVNQILPEDVEFSFHYRDSEEDLEQAQIANSWTQAVVAVQDDLDVDERRIIYTNQIEAFRDALTDEEGNIVRLNDSDPKPLETVAPEEGDREEEDLDLVAPENKAFRDTRRRFVKEFNQLVRQTLDEIISPAGSRIAFRSLLLTFGRQTFLDGIRRTGKRASMADVNEQIVSTWMTGQVVRVKNLVSALATGELTERQAKRKGNLWANGSLEDLLYKAMVDTAPKQKWRWVINFLKENCITCLQLNGQIHLMSTFIRLGLVPKSVKLVCTGRECGCGLKKTDDPVKGRLRSVRFVRRDSL